MADQEAIRRKHDLLVTAMDDYFWHTAAEALSWTVRMGCIGITPGYASRGH
jgi:hypothetical protein